MTVIIGVDPHKSTHTAVAIGRDEQLLAWVQLVADRCQTQRLLAWAEPLGTERTWASSQLTGSASCWPSSCSERVSTSSTCPRRSPRECGCWARPRRARTTPTTRCPPPPPGCGIAANASPNARGLPPTRPNEPGRRAIHPRRSREQVRAVQAAYRCPNQSTVGRTASRCGVGSNGPNAPWNFDASETNGRSNW
jgi:hypothetical protein